MSVARTVKVAALITLASTVAGALAGVATAALLGLTFVGPSVQLNVIEAAELPAVRAPCGVVRAHSLRARKKAVKSTATQAARTRADVLAGSSNSSARLRR